VVVITVGFRPTHPFVSVSLLSVSASLLCLCVSPVPPPPLWLCVSPVRPPASLLSPPSPRPKHTHTQNGWLTAEERTKVNELSKAETKLYSPLDGSEPRLATQASTSFSDWPWGETEHDLYQIFSQVSSAEDLEDALLYLHEDVEGVWLSDWLAAWSAPEIHDYHILVVLLRCPKLRGLSLDNCANVNGNFLSHLYTQCPDLERLDVQATGVTDISISHLHHTNLQVLFLHMCSGITDSGTNDLHQRCPSLVTLNLSETSVSDDAKAQLKNYIDNVI
jgi:hypothetical protein